MPAERAGIEFEILRLSLPAAVGHLMAPCYLSSELHKQQAQISSPFTALALAWKWICSVVTVRNAVSSPKFRTSGISIFSPPVAIIQRAAWPYWCLLSWVHTRAGKPTLFSHYFDASLSITSHVSFFHWIWDGHCTVPCMLPHHVEPP